MNASSTFVDVFADVSMKTNPWSFANCSPSSLVTARLLSWSLVQLTSITTIKWRPWHLHRREQSNGTHRMYVCVKSLQRNHVDRSKHSRLVSDEHDNHIWIRVLACVIQPGREVVECVPSCDIVYQQCTCSTTVVWPCDRSKWFLASSVPDL